MTELASELWVILNVNHISAMRDPRGIAINHAQWMIENMPNDDEVEKYSRWIGYIQALMVVHGLMTLNEMRDITRETATMAE